MALVAGKARCAKVTQVDPELRELVESVWAQFKAAPSGHVVDPSIPILFFGDLAAYEASPLRVVTVALNPSYKEFPQEDPFQRFPAAADGDFLTSQDAAERYVSSLSGYFTTRPYDRWFKPGFEPVLQGLGASFYAGPNLALHTDICSPISTKEVWNSPKLPRDVRSCLNKAGCDLWHRLVGRLDPDVLLISVAGAYRDQIELESLTDWELFYPVKRENPYKFDVKKYRLPSGKTCLALFGRPVNIPYGSVSGTEKRAVGRRLLEALHV
jgi:hypothetical protein